MSVRHPSRLVRVSSLPFIAGIRLYQVTLSPIVGGQCRFHPTCSNYALDAYREYGPIRGSRLTAARLLRCHPFTRGGYDPVPPPPPPASPSARQNRSSRTGDPSSDRYPVD